LRNSLAPPVAKLFIARAASSSTLGSTLKAIATGQTPPANESTIRFRRSAAYGEAARMLMRKAMCGQAKP
jgi:hypothetical protein